MFATHHKLDNLVTIVDHNKLQAMDRSSKVLNLEPLAEKWKSFGWEVREINGHDFKEILEVLGNIPTQSGKPTCIIAHTIKGKGVSFVENQVGWHGIAPKKEHLEKALAELDEQEKALEKQ